MDVTDFDYHLPENLIAQTPPLKRGDSRLLSVSYQGECTDLQFNDICSILKEDDLLVLNDTKVIPARLSGRKETGGKIEILLERIISNNQFMAQIRASKAPKIGQRLEVDGDTEITLTVTAREGSFFIVDTDQTGDLLSWFEEVGHIPLPPYIDRDDNQSDKERYQTVFANQHGAVAAPTAGLHYDELLLNTLRKKGVQIETVTLHVGAGTYQPVRVDTLDQHKMHSEQAHVTQSVCDAVIQTNKRGGRVCAAGTTVVRALETAAQKSVSNIIEPYTGETNIFIYPGYEFKVIDMLQTNFHLPQSTLLMLVSAFSGIDVIKNVYTHAINNEYQFFSYGDTMILEK